jgi:hypothetical protein
LIDHDNLRLIANENPMTSLYGMSSRAIQKNDLTGRGRKSSASNSGKIVKKVMNYQ